MHGHFGIRRMKQVSGEYCAACKRRIFSNFVEGSRGRHVAVHWYSESIMPGWTRTIEYRSFDATIFSLRGFPFSLDGIFGKYDGLFLLLGYFVSVDFLRAELSNGLSKYIIHR